jgi:hypothetical protein
LFVYGSARANATNPKEHTIEFLLPLVIASFVLTFFGVPDLIIGLIVLLLFLVILKYYDNIPLRPWITTVLKILAIMLINNQFGPWVGKIMLYLLIIWTFIEGEIKIRKLKREAKKKEKNLKK